MKASSVELSNHGRLGVLLIIIGVLLAIDVLCSLSFIYKLWPLLLLLLGIGFCGIYRQRSRKEAIYIGIGSYFLGLTGIFLYCSLISWEILATIWPSFITLLGISLCLGYVGGRRKPLLLLAGLIFLSISAVFFFVFTIDYQLWWTVFILTGISFLLFDKRKHAQ